MNLFMERYFMLVFNDLKNKDQNNYNELSNMSLLENKNHH